MEEIIQQLLDTIDKITELDNLVKEVKESKDKIIAKKLSLDKEVISYLDNGHYFYKDMMMTVNGSAVYFTKIASLPENPEKKPIKISSISSFSLQSSV